MRSTISSGSSCSRQFRYSSSSGTQPAGSMPSFTRVGSSDVLTTKPYSLPTHICCCRSGLPSCGSKPARYLARNPDPTPELQGAIPRCSTCPPLEQRTTLAPLSPVPTKPHSPFACPRLAVLDTHTLLPSGLPSSGVSTWSIGRVMVVVGLHFAWESYLCAPESDGVDEPPIKSIVIH